MNIANAFGEVSYRTIRTDDLDSFYRETGPKVIIETFPMSKVNDAFRSLRSGEPAAAGALQK
jgi:hypothetical protein